MVVGYVYYHKIVTDDGKDKYYIGITTHSPIKRWGKGGKGYLKGSTNTKFAKAIRKYGWDRFEHHIIGTVEAETKEQLILDLGEWEKYYIDMYDSVKNGYNTTTGGRSCAGYKCSDEHVERNRKAQKLLHQKRLESGVPHHSKGKPLSEEVKRKMKESHADFHGEKHPRAKKVKCLTTGEEFGCLKHAAEKYSVYPDEISRCCKGIKESVGFSSEGEPLKWVFIK